MPVLPINLDYFKDFASNVTEQAEDYVNVAQASELWDWILELLTHHNIFRPAEVDFLGDPFITFSHQAITVYFVWYTFFLLFLFIHMVNFYYYGTFEICRTTGLLQWIYVQISICGVKDEPDYWPLKHFEGKVNATNDFLAVVLWPIYKIPFNLCWLHSNCPPPIMNMTMET